MSRPQKLVSKLELHTRGTTLASRSATVNGLALMVRAVVVAFASAYSLEFPGVRVIGAIGTQSPVAGLSVKLDVRACFKDDVVPK
jgi:hypothetical protein